MLSELRSANRCYPQSLPSEALASAHQYVAAQITKFTELMQETNERNNLRQVAYDLINQQYSALGRMAMRFANSSVLRTPNLSNLPYVQGLQLWQTIQLNMVNEGEMGMLINELIKIIDLNTTSSGNMNSRERQLSLGEAVKAMEVLQHFLPQDKLARHRLRIDDMKRRSA